jgi:hypothetical protein
MGRETPALDEDQASAGAQSDPTALLHSWRAAVTLPLSRSMRGSRRRADSTGVLLCAICGTWTPEFSAIADRARLRRALGSDDPAAMVTRPRRSLHWFCMSARGRGRVSGALLGGASAVLHNSPVPVVVLLPPQKPRETSSKPGGSARFHAQR